MKYNTKLNNARKSKMDEFFTEYSTIEREMVNYIDFFENKTIYCNCDNYEKSNFYKFFVDHFNEYKLKGLICSWYDINGGYICRYYDGKNHIEKLDFDGDFRDDKFNYILEESDVVITNPPFSLFRDFIKVMIKNNKKFIVLGNLNALKYKDIFPYIKNNEIYLGKSIHCGDVEFIVPDEFFDAEKTKNYRIDENDGTKYVKVPSIRWYTNIKYKDVNNYKLELCKTYNSNDYLVYDYYKKAINCNKVKDIPSDYYDEIGVPINYIDKHNSEIFDIIGILRCPILNGKRIYDRILLKRVKK
jgi:hypothetical protein